MPQHCKCGNKLQSDDIEGMCEWCENIASEPAHVGHWSLFGTYWCDTCNSPYCNLL